MGQSLKFKVYRGHKSKAPCIKCGYVQPQKKRGRPKGSKNKKK